MRAGETFVAESQRLRGWYEVREVKAGGSERLYAGPFLRRERAESLSAAVNGQRSGTGLTSVLGQEHPLDCGYCKSGEPMIHAYERVSE
jgi:hypothetical protein